MQTCTNCNTQNRDSARYCSACGALLVKTPHTSRMTGMLAPNTILQGRYSIQRKIAEGGMSAVYTALDIHIPAKVWVVKEMSDAALSPQERLMALSALEREARLLVTLGHPNLPRVVNCFASEGRYYLVMEFVTGETLEGMLARSGPLPETQVLRWAEQLCDVLSYLHSQSPPLIHGDLKLSSVMITPDGQVKLIDFIIASLFKPGKTRGSVCLGTPGFASPEQYGKGQVDPRSDIFSLGVLLHSLLTGHDPSLTPLQLPPIRALNPNISRRTEEIIRV